MICLLLQMLTVVRCIKQEREDDRLHDVVLLQVVAGTPDVNGLKG